jgi:hypothetical protein
MDSFQTAKARSNLSVPFLDPEFSTLMPSRFIADGGSKAKTERRGIDVDTAVKAFIFRIILCVRASDPGQSYCLVAYAKGSC